MACTPHEDGIGSPLRVIVIGARRAKQGTGRFIAEWFVRSGATVCGIVGTSEPSVTEALAGLAGVLDDECRGYTSVYEAIERERPDAVAVCSPYVFHVEHLCAAAEAGLHCLCEKPLTWRESLKPDDPDPVARAVERFASQSLLLEVVAQWPETLEAFFEIHPRQRGQVVERFEMGLSPITTGLEMIPDAAPHFLSMLSALGGQGEVTAIRFQTVTSESLTIRCRYRHERGEMEAALHLTRCARTPRPAWYAINGARVDREVELPEYRQYLASGDRRVPLADPLRGVVERFIDGVRQGRTTDVKGILRAQNNLERLGRAFLER